MEKEIIEGCFFSPLDFTLLSAFVSLPLTHPSLSLPTTFFYYFPRTHKYKMLVSINNGDSPHRELREDNQSLFYIYFLSCF